MLCLYLNNKELPRKKKSGVSFWSYFLNVTSKTYTTNTVYVQFVGNYRFHLFSIVLIVDNR